MTVTLAGRRLAATRDATLRPGTGPERRRTLTVQTREHLRVLWEQASSGLPTEGLALGCVGSLARGESGPLSDLDLVLLHDGRLSRDLVAALADAIWYPLWESGLRLDHSVRTLADCRAVADTDLAALVGLLDLDHIAGDETLVAGVRARVARDWRAAARRRLPAVLAEVEARHLKYGDLADLLEPDLKEARGGLRDITLMRSLTAAWLADRPHGPALDAATEKLLDVRDAIHLVSGRGRERLVREDRDAVAAVLAYGDGDDLLAATSDAARVVALATGATLRRARQALRARTLRVGPRRPHLRPLGHGVYEHEGEVVLGAAALRRMNRPGGDPSLALRAGALAARAGLPLAAATVDTLTGVTWEGNVWTPARRELFTALLGSGPGLREVWEQATVAGLVERWLPAWRAVRSRPQHDPVHRHTVDRHQVQAVIECAPLLDDVERADLLLVAALLHDLGKAHAGPDHPAQGAPIAREATLALGFGEADAAVVAVLVEHHLALVDLATSRDPADPATLDALGTAVGWDPLVLDLLAALTTADAASIGERAWTPWRARLVADLVHSGRAACVARTGAVRCGVAAGARAGAPWDLADVVSADQRAAALAGRPVVLARPGVDPTALVIDVVAADRLGLFGDVAGGLSAQGIAVRRAVLRTVDGVAVDTWDCDAESGTGLDAERLAQDLVRLGSVRTARAHGVRSFGPKPPDAAPGTSAASAPTQPQALLVPDAASDATVIELRAADRPGLLRDVGLALARMGIAVRRAHVETYAGRRRDDFHLVDGPSGAPLRSPGGGARRGGADRRRELNHPGGFVAMASLAVTAPRWTVHDLPFGAMAPNGQVTNGRLQGSRSTTRPRTAYRSIRAHVASRRRAAARAESRIG